MSYFIIIIKVSLFSFSFFFFFFTMASELGSQTDIYKLYIKKLRFYALGAMQSSAPSLSSSHLKHHSRIP